jgi:hypothetical protein
VSGMRLFCLTTAGALLCALAACVTAESAFKDDGLTRAAFELECPAEELTVTVLERNDGMGCAGSTVGVEGCGKKAVYVCTREQTWVNNTAVESKD